MAPKKSALIQLLQIALGVLFGVLVTVFAYQVRERIRGQKVMYGQWRKLNLILDQVERNYVDTIDFQGMTDAAVTAALAELDPHSVYMPPVEKQESDSQLAGNFDGIGIQFNVPNDTAIVLEVIPGGPSEKVGLLPGDRLLKVDDKVIAGVGFPQDSMVRRMKGPSGTKVTVTVKRGREEIPFHITRGKIPVHCVDASFMINDTTGYIRLSKFSRTTYTEYFEAVTRLVAQGMNRLIFDLRDNTGGYLDQAVLLANDFLDKGNMIVYMEGRRRARLEYSADGRGTMRILPLTILINEGTASASEIVAGAIQDNDRGVIVGRRSFGKGLVQEPIDFSDGSGIRLTVSRYYTPSGRCIQKPYDVYGSDIYDRYADGEVFSADSARLNKEDIHYTVGGREVYGGGGIMPDVYVPIDTTRASSLFVNCNRKASQMRFASWMFDTYTAKLREIDSFEAMDGFLRQVRLPDRFKEFIRTRDGITAPESEWAETLPYLEPQLNALVARYSKLGENAFYKYYLPIDETVKIAVSTPAFPRDL
ncbi:MAG: S41 family peptidase [Bacteroidales bacterium]|nr:S41 family peptidase [Bacteroidales bacterium]